MKFCLYSLVRRTESVPFYIGFTTRWDRRFPVHKLKFGRDIVGTVIAEYLSWEQADFAETGAIQYWISQGAKLENRAKTTKRCNLLYREARRAVLWPHVATHERKSRARSMTKRPRSTA